MTETHCHKKTGDFTHGDYSRVHYAKCPQCILDRQRISRTVVTYAVVVVIVACAVIGLVRAFS
jgi:hypothetical protein